MNAPSKQLAPFVNADDLRIALAGEYKKQIDNFFGNPKEALSFLSGVIAAVQRTPELLKCQPITVINSFMIMAQLRLMPSAVSGEAFVLPYEKGRGSGVFEAQFQLGYQGIVTLLYRAGAKQVVAEVVRKNDVFRIVNGSLEHEVDPFKTREERGESVGAYAIITLATGGKVEKFMRKEDIMDHAERFSKSYNSKFSPWDEKNDPEGWMWRKTVLKQASKLAPKNAMLNLAIAEDNKDSVIGDRLPEAKNDIASLTMGAALKKPEVAEEAKTEPATAESSVQVCPGCGEKYEDAKNIEALSFAGVCVACASKQT